MHYRPLGRTGIQISEISFGAGPVSGLMTGDDQAAQRQLIEQALAAGINWFDTAAGYGEGRSEENLGRALAGLRERFQPHVATKVRLRGQQLDDIAGSVRRSLEDSLRRLRLEKVTLLQLHNSLTATRDDEPTSITPGDVLAPGGVLEVMQQLRREGLVDHFGLTGIGQPAAMREVLASGQFAAIQVPYHLLNPSAGREMPAGFSETNYGQIVGDCQRLGVAVLAIRVYAAGALLQQAPSAHTKKTPFFPLDLYERDKQRAELLSATLARIARKGSRLEAQRLSEGSTPCVPSLQELALRYILSDSRVTSIIIGLGAISHLREALATCASGPLPMEQLTSLEVALRPIWQA